jgi:hypothetical protein
MSPEARLAWEEVDDLELLPSSVTAELPKPLDEECDVMTDEQKCREFEYAMKKLDELADGAQVRGSDRGACVVRLSPRSQPVIERGREWSFYAFSSPFAPLFFSVLPFSPLLPLFTSLFSLSSPDHPTPDD